MGTTRASYRPSVEPLQLERMVLAGSATLMVAAAITMMVGVSPAEVPPAEDYEVVQAQDKSTPRKRKRAAPRPPQAAPGYETLPSGLLVWDIERGPGPTPEEGQVVLVDYIAWLENKMAIETTSDGLDPLRFTVGAGLVPRGLEEGVAGMQVGGLRQLKAPPELAYGEEGVANRVPPGATLTYEVRLVDVWSLPEAPPTADAWSELPEGVRIAELTTGTGDVLTSRSAARFDYAMWANGVLVGSSFDKPRPMRARMGAGRLLPGWEAGMQDLRVGGHRLIEIPPELAYGSEGQGEIPPDATLLIEVRLRRVL